MKILIADKIAESGVEFLLDQPEFEVIEAYGSTAEEILRRVVEAEAVIVRSETKITAEALEAATRLKVVGRAGVGVDNIDVEAATRRGVVVMNTPEGNTIATAELTLTHLLSLARPIVPAGAMMKKGGWDRKAFAGSELFGKVLGIIGLGRIGGEVARRAKAFGMLTLAYDPYLSRERAQALEVEPVDLEEIYGRSDFITVHLPLTDSTRHLIDREAIARMKDGVRLVNCARGGIIRESDLLEALGSGKIAAAGLDVYEEEPLPEDSPLRNCPNLNTTPHLGASTMEAQKSVGLEVAKAVTDMLLRGIIRNALNTPSVDARTLKILRPHLSLGRRLGMVLQRIAPPRIAKLRITYWGKITDQDTGPLTRSIQLGYLQSIGGDGVNDVNAPLYLKRLGIEVDTIVSSQERDFTELMRLEAIEPDGRSRSVEGTLIGTANKPRLVHVNGREVEASLRRHLLLLENRDVPGIIGTIGTILGREGINIASMSLSRNTVGGMAFTALSLDNMPSQPVLDQIASHDCIAAVHFIQL